VQRFFFWFLGPELNDDHKGHDSTINIVYPGGPVVHSIRMQSLPLVTLTWTSEESIIGAGHDCRPLLFTGTQHGWQEAGTLDDATAPKTPESRLGGGSSPTVGRLKAGAFATFRDADSRGQTSTAAAGTKMTTVHQNTITSVRGYEYDRNGGVKKVSTTGVDGILVIWEVNAVTN
jgi:actin related protein 2/3 complex subunit 1A/1B